MADARAVTEAVLAALAEAGCLPVAAIRPEHHIRDDLGIDSLDLVSVVQGIETALAIRIDDQAMARVRGVAELTELARAAPPAEAAA
jgi:acyl carrier protein